MPDSLQEENSPQTQAAREAVAALVNQFLQQQGRKAGWLAQAAGIHRNTVTRLKQAQTLPDPETCQALAEAMQLPPEKLLAAAGYLPEPELLIPELDDPELSFYLSQIGQMPEKTREIVKGILENEYRQMEKGESQLPNRPPWARPLNPTKSRQQAKISHEEKE